MRNDDKSKSTSPDSVGESRAGWRGLSIGRRRFLKWIGLGGLFAANGYWIYQRWRPRKTIEVTMNTPAPSSARIPVEVPPNDLVEIGTVKMLDRGSNSHLIVTFKFKGPEDKSRRMRVAVSARGSDGQILLEQSKEVYDARPASHTPIPAGTEMFTLSSENSTFFDIPASTLKSAKTVTLRFEEA